MEEKKVQLPSGGWITLHVEVCLPISQDELNFIGELNQMLLDFDEGFVPIAQARTTAP